MVQVVLQFDELQYIEIVVLFEKQARAPLTAAAEQLKKQQVRERHYSLCRSAVSCAIHLTMRHAHRVASWYQPLHDHMGRSFSGNDSDLSTLQMTHS